MDRSKTGKSSRQKKFISDDESPDAVKDKKPEKNPKGKNLKDRGADSEDESEASDADKKQASKHMAGGKGKNRKEEEESKEDLKARVPKQKKDKKSVNKKAQKNKESDEGDDEDAEPSEQVVATKKGTQQIRSAFQLLAVEGDSSDESESDASVEEKVVTAVIQKKGKKAKQDKRKEKVAKDEDKDIDLLVAEISNMTTTSQKKKGKKTKDSAEKEEKAETTKVSNNLSEAGATPEISITGSMTQEDLYKLMDDMTDDDSDKPKARKKGKQQEAVQKQESREGASDEEDGETSTMKTAAQKRKEKKERLKAEKQKKPETKGKDKKENAEGPGKSQDMKTEDAVIDKKGKVVEEKETAAAEVKDAKEEPIQEQAKEPEEQEDESSKTSKKDKKKKKDDKEKEKTKKPSKMVQEILERQKRIKEEEEKLQREEEERIRREEEAIRLKEEEEKRIKERKERLKQKKKEKIERKKVEGTFLTEKQKEDKRRIMQMLDIYNKEIPDEARTVMAEKKPPRYEKKPKKNRQGPAAEAKNGSAQLTPVDDSKMEPVLTAEVETAETAEVQSVESPTVEKIEEEEDVKEAWDMSSPEEEEEEDDEAEENKSKDAQAKASAKVDVKKVVAYEKPAAESPSEEEDESSEDEESDKSEEESSSEEEEDGKTPQERAHEKMMARVHARIQKRKADADAKRSLDKLRAPVVCVLGHVDTGKTKILDKLRRTNVQDGEAGGITQQIGATNVPQDTIKEQTKMCKEFQKLELKLPGLLIIDTPGHESFSNLRSRGSSLCDIAILVVDIMHGLEPQTIESMNLLRQKQTPFVVALNKIDRLYGWQTNPHSDILNTLKRQKQNTLTEFNDRVKHVILQFAEQGLNATLFHENKDPDDYFSLVPTSAHTGDGMGNLIAYICEMAQTRLAERLMFSEELKATVMEVKALEGHGTTIDVILVNGMLREGNHIVVAGQEGPIVTQIRALLMPQPLRELRVKSQFEHHKEIVAAQGCKIVAKNLEKALPGLPLFVTVEPDEADFCKEELSKMLKEVLGDVKVTDKGVFVQASTLGSLEALLSFLKTSEIPFAGINIGPVHKKDITKASVMLEHDPQYAVILAFDVKVEHEAQTMADSLGVRIFTADIIYHLFDSFTRYRDEYRKQRQDEFRNIAVFPCKLRIMPQYVFNSRDPIVVGVIVEAGFLKEGTLLCVPSKEFLEVGRVSSIEINHKTIERATKGQEVCIKIDPIPGEAPKMFGRHFDENDLLVSKISRQSIDAVKNYFREEMTKPDWQLIMELKKTFDII